MLARRGAAGDLEIADPGIDAVAADNLADDDFEGLVLHRRRDAELGERTMQALQVRRLIDEAPATDRDHLVDAVGKLEAAVLDMHACLATRQILAGDIGDARHDGCASFSGEARRLLW